MSRVFCSPEGDPEGPGPGRQRRVAGPGRGRLHGLRGGAPVRPAAPHHYTPPPPAPAPARRRQGHAAQDTRG